MFIVNAVIWIKHAYKYYDLSPFDHLNISHFKYYVISPTVNMFMSFVLQLWISAFFILQKVRMSLNINIVRWEDVYNSKRTYSYS